MAGLAEKVFQPDYSSRAEYIERLIDERAGIGLVDGKIASSIVDELTGFLSSGVDIDAEDAREKALREKYGLAY